MEWALILNDEAKINGNKEHKPINLHNISRHKIKQVITNHFIDSY